MVKSENRRIVRLCKASNRRVSQMQANKRRVGRELKTQENPGKGVRGVHNGGCLLPWRD